MGNGKRGMGNGEWAMGNGEWAMGNGEWGMGNGGKARMKDDTPPGAHEDGKCSVLRRDEGRATRRVLRAAEKQVKGERGMVVKAAI